MCYGFPAVTGFLARCETGKSAALFKNHPPRVKPLHVPPFLSELKAKLLICVRRQGEERKLLRTEAVDVSWTTHEEGGEAPLVSIAVPDGAEQTGAPWCPRHIRPDGALLSAEETEVLCSARDKNA